ncbi:TetR/AcrR family transcriptional regulator [Oceanobacillus halophilus]|uniref:TetR/AcrR family transcriptional regulator n=1 Tax=Oceanobacillus halophilus TaxID=930130 RepID=A0A495A3G5_9BACI|nr:TetR/AcrR family transcriptional regulator [Oceanobacillus halophilus]RKQ33919.1 TetR/AcrR family transcriptional regulator [Oceanobacillus halophilus]
MNRKQKQIIDAAQKLFIKKGYASTSIQDILKEAQIAKGTFYNYFSSKNECLMAILELVNQEIEQERRLLVSEGESKDLSVFAKQIEVRFNIDKKHNLMQLFHSVTFTDDQVLKDFMTKLYMKEIKWIAERFKDIYGIEIERFSLDHAISFLGILQQGMLVTKFFATTSNEVAEAIKFALNQTEKIITNYKNSDVVLIHEELFHSYLYKEEDNSTDVKAMIICKLNDLQEKLDKKSDYKAINYVQFLLDEVQNEDPRVFLLESVLMSLQKIAGGTEVEQEVTELTRLAWQLIDTGDKM